MKNVMLFFGVILSVLFALLIKLTSKDSVTVDIITGVFGLLAIFCAVPIQFEGFVKTVSPLVPNPWGRRSAAVKAVKDVEEAKQATAKAAESVKDALTPEKPD